MTSVTMVIEDRFSATPLKPQPKSEELGQRRLWQNKQQKVGTMSGALSAQGWGQICLSPYARKPRIWSISRFRRIFKFFLRFSQISPQEPPRNQAIKKEHRLKLLGLDILRWGGGLPREGAEAKKFGIYDLIKGNHSFGRDFAGISWGCPTSLRKIKFVLFGPWKRPKKQHLRATFG